MTACPSCSAQVPSTSRFCPSCGAYVGWQTAAPPEPAEAPLSASGAAATEPAPTREPVATGEPRATPQPEARPETPPPVVAPATPQMQGAVQSITDVAELAARMNRPDVEAQLARTRETLQRRELTVAVIGEF